MSDYIKGISFNFHDCANCGLTFAITSNFEKRKRKSGKSFYCPAGHSLVFNGESEADKLKSKLDQKNKEINRVLSRANKYRAERDGIKKSYLKIRDRVKNGVCPCCDRTFENLLNHMKTQHPEFSNNDSLRAMRTAYGLSQDSLANEIGVNITYISKYENSKPIPAYAWQHIEHWLEQQKA